MRTKGPLTKRRRGVYDSQKSIVFVFPELREDYAEKALNPSLEWLQSWLEDEIRKLDNQIHNIKEQELCAYFQQEKILASILAKTN